MVFVMTDDQGWGDVGYNGHPKIKTPHLDAMAAAGVPLPADRAYDGIDLLPLIDGCADARPGPIGFHCNGMQAWSAERYKIVRQYAKGGGIWELYDLVEDPFEENDLAGEKPELAAEMADGFAKWFESVEADRAKAVAKHPPAKAKAKR